MMAYSYYASISFTDHEVGRILGELDTLGFASNTAVLFHADHGWKLGALCSPVYYLRVHTSVLGLHYHTVAGVTTCVRTLHSDGCQWMHCTGEHGDWSKCTNWELVRGHHFPSLSYHLTSTLVSIRTHPHASLTAAAAGYL
jgi:arylsulfatase A-like enzyme